MRWTSHPHGRPPRLRDLEGFRDASEKRAADWVRAMPPYVPVSGSKARVRSALVGARPHRARDPRRALVYGLLGLLFGGVAMAASADGRTWMVNVYRGLTAEEPGPVRRVASRAATQAERPVPNGSIEMPPAPRPMRQLQPPRSRVSRPAPLEEAVVRKERAAAVAPAVAELQQPIAAPGDVDQPHLVAEAFRALRRQRDPGRAQELLAEYLRFWPRGALVEEALVLAIEAANDSGESTDARRFAARYLQQFPRGRFVDNARRALGSDK